MSIFSQTIPASIILVTVVFGLFIFSAILRIKNSRKELGIVEKPKPYKLLKRVDLVFSSIFLVAMILVYLVFILRIGR
jgi:hypothetical protein